MIEEPVRIGAMMKIKCSLGCSDHETMEFKIVRGARRMHSKLTALDFGRADFGLFNDLLDTVPCDKALEGRTRLHQG